MKKGVKLWTRNDSLYDEATALIRDGQIDFIELLYCPGFTKDIEKLKGNDIILHGPASLQGYCFGDGQLDKNRKILKEMIELADQLGSKYMILHPEFGSIRNFIELLHRLNDERFLVENMPRYGIDPQRQLIAHTRDDVKKIMDQCGVGFCLDLAHASKAGLALKKDYKAVVRQFFALGPRVAHISDGCLDNGIDEHLDLGKGELDLNFFVSMIVNSDIEYLTFEVPKRDGLKNDIKNVAYWGSLKS